MVDFTGEFETHFTLRTEEVGSVVDWAVQAGMKLTHIMLSDGINPSQPMLTRRSIGECPKVMVAAKTEAVELAARGAEVLRVKIEIDARHPFAPATEIEAQARPDYCYFEHHVKLLLPPHTEVADLQNLASQHGAQLSRNVLRTREDGMQERFLTQRLYALGYGTSELALRKLTDDLKDHAFTILECDAEYVIYDSNRELDSGWLPTH